MSSTIPPRAPAPVHVVVLAAGKGTRMKSRRPKVLHPLAGLPLIGHAVRTAKSLAPASITLVLGHGAEAVQHALSSIDGLTFVTQEPQLGTGHALLQAEPVLAGRTGTVVLLSGDVPLLRAESVERLVAHHVSHGAAATVLTTRVDDPFGYGRIVRTDGRIARIVEHRDATLDEQRIREVNSGIYAFDLPPLFDALRAVATGNSQGEYYLPDLVSIYRARGRAVETVALEDPTEVQGVNSQAELAALAAAVRRRLVEALMTSGVTCLDPATTYVDVDVRVAADTVLHPNVYLEGRTVIGAGCEIHAGTRVVDCTVEDGVVIRNHCVLQSSRISSGAVLGPFAHIRPDSDVGAGAHVGNFVELKKTTLGPGSKANHLAYLGDATVGSGVNVGAGTITCNYDGTHKHRTVIEDGAFIGSDSQLVAPVRVGRGAYVAAGSSITSDVPDGALGIARARQVNKDGWAASRRKK
jgi:bifunctional UDP-N-acetylglucosamine pyrophosphorylase/glucosamine-1-phosphate N-acetyltransferase